MRRRGGKNSIIRSIQQSINQSIKGASKQIKQASTVVVYSVHSSFRDPNRRKPMSAAAEDVTFALINSGMFGTAAKTNEELMMTLQARAEGRGWRRKSSE
eukprot:768746-Hanusia_phi.AAC.1